MAVVLILGAGCRTAFEEGGKHGLPPAPPGTTDFSDYQPIHSFEPSGSGVAERTVYFAPSDEGYAVEVRDFLVSPEQPEAKLALAGAAVLEVRQGAGEATVRERRIGLRPGIVFTADAGEALRVTARGEPLTLRTWIVSPGQEP
jgi:hypothetical protein